MSLSSLYDRRILITGATGFVGGALTKYLVQQKEQSNTSLEIWLAVRRPNLLIRRLLDRQLIAGIIISDFGSELACPSPIDYVFHCATPASANLTANSPLQMFDLNISGMRWIIESEVVRNSTPRVLFTSSGAVYGEQSADMSHIPEGFSSSPDVMSMRAAYGEGKRAAEFMLCAAGHRGDLRPLVARLFTFSGIGLPLQRHFAIGNFVDDVRRGRDIEVRSSGKGIRSYLDVKDMVEWLLMIAAKGDPFTPYHVGSEHSISISELAFLVAERGRKVLGTNSAVLIQNQVSSIDGVDRYVPSTRYTRSRLGVTEKVKLHESIDQMLVQS